MRITFTGVVQQGERKGTLLGFPTINIPLGDPAITGIYAGEVDILGKAYQAVLYANTRRALLEAHILDFSENIYETPVIMVLLEKIREDEHFENEGALMSAIAEDVTKAREYFKER